MTATETIEQPAPALDWDVPALAAQFFPAARSVAWKMHQRCPAGSVDLDELISVASVGLVTALNRYPAYCAERGFDIANTTYVGAYVSRRMKGACLDFLRGEDYLTRSARQRAGKLWDAGASTSATARRSWPPGRA